MTENKKDIWINAEGLQSHIESFGQPGYDNEAKTVRGKTLDQENQAEAVKKNNKFKCPCGWIGESSDLIKKGCLSDADEWYECPSCNRDGSTLTRVK